MSPITNGNDLVTMSPLEDHTYHKTSKTYLDDELRRGQSLPMINNRAEQVNQMMNTLRRISSRYDDSMSHLAPQESQRIVNDMFIAQQMQQ